MKMSALSLVTTAEKRAVTEFIANVRFVSIQKKILPIDNRS